MKNNLKPELPNKPWPGVRSMFSDINTRVVGQASLEAFQASGPAKTKTPKAGGDDGSSENKTTIYKKNGAYYVFFDTWEVCDWGDNPTSFSMWLMSLEENDVVYIHQTGDVWSIAGIAQVLSVLDTDCKAKKIFVVDHPIENALFLTVCDELRITDMGAITFSNAMCVDPSKWDLAYMPYLQTLYAKAVEKKLINEAEVNAVIHDNKIIFKSARDLRAQGVVSI
jgi:hypothetical protein